VEVAGPWVLAIVFAVSGVAKAFNPQPAMDTIGVLLGGWSPAWSGAVLVLVEVLLAAWLVSGFRPRAALVVAATLLFMFSVALGLLFWVSPESPCGCGLPALSGNTAVDKGIGIARNALLIAIAALAWPASNSLYSKTKESLTC